MIEEVQWAKALIAVMNQLEPNLPQDEQIKIFVGVMVGTAQSLLAKGYRREQIEGYLKVPKKGSSFFWKQVERITYESSGGLIGNA